MEEVVERLVYRLQLGKVIREHLFLPPRPPRLVPFPEDLLPPLRQALLRRGVRSLYHHQLKAYLSVRRGAHLLLATPTASGKSWALFLPLLQHLAENPSSTALLLFPTKALAREKARELEGVFEELGLGRPLALDGESPPGERRMALRARAILTNPEMLRWHLEEWWPFLSRAAFLLVDELHLHQGLGGAALAGLAEKIKAFSPQVRFLCASATVGDPRGFFRRLFGASPLVIAESGAPVPARHLLSLRPPPGKEPHLASLLARHLVLEEGLDCLVFARGRQEAEMLLARMARLFPRWWGPLLRSYHAGLLPEERKEAEREVGGRRVGVFICTSAWEVGVEGGEFRAGILFGYPGSRESFRQRVGRIGRKEEGLVLTVGSFPPLRELLFDSLSPPPLPEGLSKGGSFADLPPPRNFPSPSFVRSARGSPLLREEEREELFLRGALHRVEKGVVSASLPFAPRKLSPFSDPPPEDEMVTVRLPYLLRGVSGNREALWLPYPPALRHPFPRLLILRRGKAIASRAGLAPGDVEISSRPPPGGSAPAIFWRDPFPGAGGVEVLWSFLCRRGQPRSTSPSPALATGA